MFSRFSTETKQPVKPAEQPKAQVAPQATIPAAAVDAERGEKRRSRMAEIKLNLHRVLLETLNLAALEKASERELREEIRNIMNEYLESNSIVVNRDDRMVLQDDL